MLLNGVSAETVITKVKTEDLRSWKKKQEKKNGGRNEGRLSSAVL